MSDDDESEIQISYRNTIIAAFNYLAGGLKSFVEQQLKQRYRDAWTDNISSISGHVPTLTDPYILLATINDRWPSAFEGQIKVPQSVIKELQRDRNAATHSDELFSDEKVNKSISSMLRLLNSIPTSQKGIKTADKIKQLKYQPLLDTDELVPIVENKNTISSDATKHEIETTENDKQKHPENSQQTEQSQAIPIAVATQDAPAVTYNFSRLCFKANQIEPLNDDQVFRVVTPVGTFQMTKAEFHRAFPKVVASKSYAENGIYHYPAVPKSALPYKLPE